jgi:hypothetical protein
MNLKTGRRPKPHRKVTIGAGLTLLCHVYGMSSKEGQIGISGTVQSVNRFKNGQN